MPVKHATAGEGDSRKYLPLGSPLFPLMSLCMVVRTLKKSASRRSMARAEVTDSTAGSDSSQERRIVDSWCLERRLTLEGARLLDGPATRDKLSGGLGTLIQMKCPATKTMQSKFVNNRV
jgi:hypothetical protein